MKGCFLFLSILVGLIKDTVYKLCIVSDLNFFPYSERYFSLFHFAAIPVTQLYHSQSLIWPKHSTILVQPQFFSVPILATSLTIFLCMPV